MSGLVNLKTICLQSHNWITLEKKFIWNNRAPKIQFPFGNVYATHFSAFIITVFVALRCYSFISGKCCAIVTGCELPNSVPLRAVRYQLPLLLQFLFWLTAPHGHGRSVIINDSVKFCARSFSSGTPAAPATAALTLSLTVVTTLEHAEWSHMTVRNVTRSRLTFEWISAATDLPIQFCST